MGYVTGYSSASRYVKDENGNIVKENGKDKTEEYLAANTAWSMQKIHNEKDYQLNYIFAYLPNQDNGKGEVYYFVTKDDPEASGDKAGEEAVDEIYDEITDAIEDEENYLSGLMTIAINRLQGEERKVYDAFHDVLSDVGFYTNINGIESKDAQEVENKVGKVVAVITNIGLVLAIVIPAILGVQCYCLVFVHL